MSCLETRSPSVSGAALAAHPFFGQIVGSETALTNKFSAFGIRTRAKGMEAEEMLTNVAIKAFKPADRPYKKADAAGLFLLIQPNGSKIWRFAYRYDGKQKLLSGGPYTQTTLRTWRELMKHQLALGMDPTVPPPKRYSRDRSGTCPGCRRSRRLRMLSACLRCRRRSAPRARCSRAWGC